MESRTAVARGTADDEAAHRVHRQHSLSHTLINESLLRFSTLHHNAHPMAMVSAVVASMSAFYHDTMDIHNRAIGRSFPTASSPNCRRLPRPPTALPGASVHLSANDLDYAGNVLNMVFAVPCEPTRSTRSPPRRSICCSCCTLITSRTPAPPRCASPAAPAPIRTRRYRGRLGALGPAHGGANEAVLAMLEQNRSVDNIPKHLAMAKDKSGHFRLMGFGHRTGFAVAGRNREDRGASTEHWVGTRPRRPIIKEHCVKRRDARRGLRGSPLALAALSLTAGRPGIPHTLGISARV